MEAVAVAWEASATHRAPRMFLSHISPDMRACRAALVLDPSS